MALATSQTAISLPRMWNWMKVGMSRYALPLALDLRCMTVLSPAIRAQITVFSQLLPNKPPPWERAAVG